MKGNGSLQDDRSAAASSSFTTFHPHPLNNPFADAAGQKRATPDAASAFVGNLQDGHNNTSTTATTEAAASSSPPAASSPTGNVIPGGKKPKRPAPVRGPAAAAAGGDGATIEVARRPRGRPPGSKNKPKQPVALGAVTDSGALGGVVSPDRAEYAAGGASAMRPHILEVPAGHDIAESLAAFSRHRDTGVSALAATGPVSNVTLRQPHMASSSPAAVVTLHGRFDLLSISATFFPPSFLAASPLLPPAAAGTVSVSLAGPHGQIVGGAVAGPLVAAGTVTVIAATFGCPSYHRLPLDDELSVSVSVSTVAGDTSSGGGGPTGRAAAAGDFHVDQAPPAAAHPRHDYAHHQQQQHHSNQQQQQQHHISHQATSQPDPAVTSLPIPTSHLLSDVIWAPRDHVRRRPF